MGRSRSSPSPPLPSWSCSSQPSGASPAEPREAPGAGRRRDPGRPWYAPALRLLPRAAGRWVDLGCGRGELLELARSRGIGPGFGLDRSRGDLAAAAAPGIGAGSLVADLGRPLPFRDGSLDGASLVEVIEHLTGAEALVSELARVIRPGGWLVVTTPNVAHLTYRWRALAGGPPKQEGYHVRFFTRATLLALFEARGFTLCERASFGKQALLTKLHRLAGRDRSFKFRYTVPLRLEALLAQHLVWRLARAEGKVATSQSSDHVTV